MKADNAKEKVKLSVAPDGSFVKDKTYEVTTPTKLNIPAFKPRRGKVLLDPLPAEETKLASGIILPGQEDKEPRAIVVAVGPGVEDMTVGDIVLIGEPRLPMYFINGHAYVSCYESAIEGTYIGVRMGAEGPVKV